MTVFGNIAYPLQVRKMDKPTITEKVNAVAKTMQITGVLQKSPISFRRPAAARGDCPHAGARRGCLPDGRAHVASRRPARGQMRAELRHIQKTIGTTTIFVTHDQLEAMTHGRPHHRDERGRDAAIRNPR